MEFLSLLFHSLFALVTFTVSEMYPFVMLFVAFFLIATVVNLFCYFMYGEY